MNSNQNDCPADYVLRQATEQDFAAVWRILRQAADWMMANGRDQWDDKYPTAQSVQGDIASGSGWVIECQRQVVAYCAIALDGEPAYEALQGQWLTAGPYAVIHRMAVDLSHRNCGLAHQFYDHAEQLSRDRQLASVRVDTNHDNAEMLALIEKRGYRYCGKVWYLHGGRRVERVAYEKLAL